MTIVSLASLTWLVAKTGMFLGSSACIIAGLQYHHNFKLNDKGAKNDGDDRQYSKQRLERLKELAKNN
ncbi:hypothetical protein [Bacillus sp. Marseille-P3800]|uniref:hypothetical protein n=1 Tax=Bacillus sp. Marseille-P3800 TaxID=2014782 RepID=UPI000C079311|nr:hypothetical protein [Bacillus sp. Marseille-P3800]